MQPESPNERLLRIQKEAGWEAEESRARFRLSREERDYIAGHALDSIHGLAKELGYATQGIAADVAQNHSAGSDCCRKIAALSNLLSDIGWQRDGGENLAASHGDGTEHKRFWVLGELFPVAQLRPWLEEWQRRDEKALVEVEGALEAGKLETPPDGIGRTVLGEMERLGGLRKAVADAQTKLGIGAILLARIEKWTASHGN